MNDFASIPYASRSPIEGADSGSLMAIAICHYVWGALLILLSCVFIFHILIGVMMLNGKAPVHISPTAPPIPLGFVFIFIGSGGMLLGWSAGILTIMSGRAIARRRGRMFSLVMAGVNCALPPIGTLLGVLTFIVLLRSSVRTLYPA